MRSGMPRISTQKADAVGGDGARWLGFGPIRAAGPPPPRVEEGAQRGCDGGIVLLPGDFLVQRTPDGDHAFGRDTAFLRVEVRKITRKRIVLVVDHERKLRRVRARLPLDTCAGRLDIVNPLRQTAAQSEYQSGRDGNTQPTSDASAAFYAVGAWHDLPRGILPKRCSQVDPQAVVSDAHAVR